MVQLSAVIITFDEERNIGRCIDSLNGIADEIVVIDSFSTDKTKEICLSKNVKFIEHAFDGHIEQKNWAITQAKYPHILSLDADEALDEMLKKSILTVKQNFTQDAYKMNRLTNYCGQWIKHCGWYPDTKLRLWDSTKGYWTGINPHDEFKLHSSTKIGTLKGDILHYSYYNLTDHIKQVEYFTTILAKAMFDAGKKSSLLKILFSPIAKFIQGYFLQKGFLDGFNGFVICTISSFATFLKYVKLKQLQS
jgi:glycosyltransferase involved in cell wall biosynthesis